MTRPMIRLFSLCGALCALCLVAASPALADRDAIIADCADDGKLQGKYSSSELRDARKNLPSDIAEYTDCADVLRRGELPSGGGSSSSGSGATAAAAGGGGGSSPSGGSGAGSTQAPSTPDETRKLEQVAANGGDQAISVGGRSVVPGASGLTPDAARNSIPGTLVAVLLLLLLAAAVAATPALRRRLREGDWPWRGSRPGLPGSG